MCSSQAGSSPGIVPGPPTDAVLERTGSNEPKNTGRPYSGSSSPNTNYSSAVLPGELLEEILLVAWLHVPLFNAYERWVLFCRLSLTSRYLRKIILGIVKRHVRVLAHSSTDIRAYREVGQQCLALRGIHIKPHDPALEPALQGLFQHSTVYIDVTYAAYAMWMDPRAWLTPNTMPSNRPGEDGFGPDELTLDALLRDTEPSDALREREHEYRAWLSRHFRGYLAGWFADLLDAVPDCAAVVVSAAGAVEPFTSRTYAVLLESVRWWSSLASVHLRVAFERPSSTEVYSGLWHGPFPHLPQLPKVRTVALDAWPQCMCAGTDAVGVQEGTTREACPRQGCIARRVLQPFPGIRRLYVDDEFSIPVNVDFPRGVIVRLGESATHAMHENPSNDERVLQGPVPRLGVSYRDTLWQMMGSVCGHLLHMFSRKIH
ncbi:hypothetical protein BD413DRAFT_635607 [Trametes elegans]|nr:hypothetical protein BD413DRAFT_635607 [Trametes elegans]